MVDKIYLKMHMSHREELRNEKEQLELIESRMSPKGQQIDGMPHSSRSQEAAYIHDTFEKMEIEKKIQDLSELVMEEFEVINQIIDKLTVPDEKMVLKLRYFRCMEWSQIRGTLFQKRYDYSWNEEKYKDKVFKIHGAALKHLKEIQNEGSK